MGRSQRHKVIVQQTDSAGKGLSEKQPAPRYIRQFAASQAFSNFTGPAGGPLQGSTIAGFPPTLIPAPGVLAANDAELTAEGGFSEPGQFDNTGNPLYTDLPPSNEPTPEPPEPEEYPILDSLDPATAVVGDADVTMSAVGRNFDETAVIVFNGGDEETTFVSDTELTTVVKPSLASGPSEVPVLVRQGEYTTNALNFSFTEALEEGGGEEELPEARAARDFPLGPFDLVKVVDEGDTLRFFLASRVAILPGDSILIEATGATQVNGAYTVKLAAFSGGRMAVVVDNDDVELPQPIEGRGRLTVTGEG